ncbi:alpha/beta hydrolase [Alteromonas oceanisediminis]|uniref:alpha/beta hydrolase n=1 Tax=Alteromonas oceanisediminis TaxID=2836180 RepID=UPI001BD9E083|nr:alpha/beta hydrolase [Alteromonas oceanisediminis]MBT0585642.1 alpha/beta hydrolase [Alteromonas oceanisediminis]
MKLIGLVACIVLMSGCAKVLFTTANTATLGFDGEIVEDIAYGDMPRQTLDMFVPAKQDLDNREFPVVVFFHGGRWTFGDKSQYQFVGTRLAEMGYVVVIPNTRLYPEVKFPTFVEDAAKAVAWAFEQTGQYGGNGEVFLTGHSSGAHIAALVTANPAYLEAHDISSHRISGFAGMAGPYDFEPKEDDLKDMFGPPERYPEMAVTTFISGDEPPMLLMYSNNDETVHITNLRKLESAIKQHDGTVKTIIYEGGGHAGTVAALSWANPAGLPVANDLNAFFQSVLSR